METGSSIRNRRILNRILLVILAAALLAGVIAVLKCAGDNKYVYPEFRKKVASLEELKLGVKDIPDLRFPGLGPLGLEPASVEYSITMTSPKRTAKPNGYRIVGSGTEDTGAVYMLHAYRGDPLTSDRGTLYYKGVEIREYSDDPENCRQQRLIAYIDGCNYVFSAEYDYGHTLTEEEAAAAAAAIRDKLFLLMQDVIEHADAN